MHDAEATALCLSAPRSESPLQRRVAMRECPFPPKAAVSMAKAQAIAPDDTQASAPPCARRSLCLWQLARGGPVDQDATDRVPTSLIVGTIVPPGGLPAACKGVARESRLLVGSRARQLARGESWAFVEREFLCVAQRCHRLGLGVVAARAEAGRSPGLEPEASGSPRARTGLASVPWRGDREPLAAGCLDAGRDGRSRPRSRVSA